MPTVFLYSDLYLPTFPQLELPLFEEIKKRGIDVKFILEQGDYRLQSEYKNIFLPIAFIIKNPSKELPKIVGNKDLVIMRFCYKMTGGKTANALRAFNKRILMLDPAAVDLKHRECSAQYITSKSEWMTKQVQKKFPGRYKKIFTTGTIHFDEAFWTKKLNKQQIMLMHGLDPNKKLVILCKASSGEIGHQKGVDDEYKKIVEIVKKCSDYELLFKMHPLDHHSSIPIMPGIIHKGEHYNNKMSYEVLFPNGIKILKPNIGYEAYAASDCILNVRSSVGMETPMFPVPLININRHKYLTNWPDSKNKGVMRDIKIEELERVLKNNDYFVDKDACKKFVLDFCDPKADGKSYYRTADIVEELINIT